MCWMPRLSPHLRGSRPSGVAVPAVDRDLLKRCTQPEVEVVERFRRPLHQPDLPHHRVHRAPPQRAGPEDVEDIAAEVLRIVADDFKLLRTSAASPASPRTSPLLRARLHSRTGAAAEGEEDAIGGDSRLAHRQGRRRAPPRRAWALEVEKLSSAGCGSNEREIVRMWLPWKAGHTKRSARNWTCRSTPSARFFRGHARKVCR